MNPAKGARIQLSLQRCNAPPQQMRLAAHMHTDVVVLRLHPVDVRDLHIRDLPEAAQREPLRLLLRDIFLQRNFLFGALHRELKTRIVEWLQEIVERTGIERAQRMRVVCRYKNDDGLPLALELAEYVKSPAFGH